MSIRYKLKAAITERGFTLKSVNDELNKRHGTNYSIQNFSNKLRKSSFSYDDVEEILDIVGYTVEWVKK